MSSRAAVGDLEASACPCLRQHLPRCFRKDGSPVRCSIDSVLTLGPEHSAYCIPFNSYASPTPAIEEGRVYVHFGTYGTACLDTAGARVLWSRRDLPCNHHRGAGSSPVLFRNLLILTFDGFDQQYLVALDTQTGETRWKQPRVIDYGTDNGDRKKAYSTPAVFTIGGQPQLVSPSAAATVAYDPATGKELWKVYHGGMNVAARPLLGQEQIYLCTGDGPTQLLAVRTGGAGAGGDFCTPAVGVT